jgi:stage II sporulation protein AB (anti-sigma F factor)
MSCRASPAGTKLPGVFATQGTFSRSYPALRESVWIVRHEVTEFAATNGASEARLEAVKTAVSEAVANSVLHAYRAVPGEVHVTAAVSEQGMWILVADDGCGFQTPAREPGLGWGLALIAHAADELVIAERTSGGTEVRMRFALSRR